jgi:hypothetical protein
MPLSPAARYAGEDEDEVVPDEIESPDNINQVPSSND